MDYGRLFKKLGEMLGPVGFNLLTRSLSDAIEFGADVSRIYHAIASLYRDYYGDLHIHPVYDGYYKEYRDSVKVKLPKPIEVSGKDILHVIKSRRSRRTYSNRMIKLKDLATILYYSVGITGRAWWGGPKRMYPSAGGLQPIEAYLSVSRVEGLDPGLYHYNPGLHALELIKSGDHSREIMDISLGQEHVGLAPMVIILTAVYSRTASRYGQRSYRYIHWDAGFAGQNIYLTCEALGMATVAVGAFYDIELCKLLEVDCRWEIPMLIFPVGYRR